MDNLILSADITIETRVLHELPSTHYGHFIEHLGRCIKGGFLAEEERNDLFMGEVRPELLKALKLIKPSVIRYPGGCFADGYHWQDGIGPRENRPRRKNLAWRKLGSKVGPLENNQFGTDEFLRLCEELGAEPQLTVNIGSGTVDEALDWLEYCNGPKDSKWGAERAKNGHPEPYNVKYWFIGNETFGPHEIGNMKPEKYVEVFKAFSKAMKKLDPTIKTIAVGAFLNRKREKIHEKVLKGAGEDMDYLSIHLYATFNKDLRAFLNTMIKCQLLKLHRKPSRKLYYEIMDSLAFQEAFVAGSVDDVRAYSPAEKNVLISFDEWNCWYTWSDAVEARYNLRDALWVASCLHINHRHGEMVTLSNIAQMVNCLGIVTSTSRGTFMTPSALVYQIYAGNAGNEYLANKVECPAMPGKEGLPALDISPTRRGNIVALFAVNRHLDAPVAAECVMKGMNVKPTARVLELYHPDAFRYNSYEAPHDVRIGESLEELKVEKTDIGSRLSLNLKKHSLKCYLFELL